MSGFSFDSPRPSCFQVLKQKGLWVALSNPSDPLFPSLLPHQREALRFFELWSEDNSLKKEPCTIVLPTGAGKSGVACLAPIVLGCSKTLVIAPSLQISKQLRKDFGGSLEKGGLEEMFIVKRGIVTVEVLERNFCLPTAVDIEPFGDWSHASKFDVTITNAHKFTKESSKDWTRTLPLHLWNLLIVDEAHHFPSSFWNNIVEACKKANLPVLFLTASPYRTDGRNVIELDKITPSRSLRDHFPEQNGFYYRLPMQKAIERRVIRAMEGHPITTVTRLDRAPVLTNGRIEWKPVPKSQQRRSGADWNTLRQVRKILLEKDRECPLPDRVRHRAMILAQDTAHAKELYAMLFAQGSRNTVMYHSKHKDSKKDLGRFMSEKCSENILIVVDSLREGFDFPPVSVVALCGRVVSPVKFYQFVGRGFRLYRQGGVMEDANIKCSVLYHTFYDTLSHLYDQCRNEHLIEELEDRARERNQLLAQQAENMADDLLELDLLNEEDWKDDEVVLDEDILPIDYGFEEEEDLDNNNNNNNNRK